MITPIGHKILVKPDKVDTTSKGGLILAIDEKLERAGQIRGTLVAMGSQAWKAFSSDFTGAPWAQIGDRVIFSRYAGKCVIDPETEEEFQLMNDEDLVAIVTGEPQ